MCFLPAADAVPLLFYATLEWSCMSVDGELEQISRFLNGIGHHAYICLDKAARVVSSTRMAQDIAGLTATEAHGRLFTHMLPRVADGQESLDTMVLEGCSTPDKSSRTCDVGTARAVAPCGSR